MGIHFRVQVYFSLSLKVVAAWRSVVLIRDLMSIWCLYLQKHFYHSQFNSVQSFSRVWLFATPWIAAHQASLSITNSRSSLRLTSIESVMPSSHLILCCPLFLLPSIFPNSRVFSNGSALQIRWPKYWSFSFSISPSNEYWRIDAFGLWCWRRLLRVPWTARRSNQSILKEISPGCSLEGMMLKLKLQ